MSLNNIILPTALLAELYQHSLVDGPVRPTPVVVSPVPSFGGNEKNILILTQQNKAAFLPEKELEFLTAVLSACQLGLHHVAIVNTNTVEGRNLIAQFNPKEVLFLNVSPDAIGFGSGFSEYAVQESGGVRWVHAPSLSEIEKTKQSKSKLWVALKQLFCLQ